MALISHLQPLQVKTRNAISIVQSFHREHVNNFTYMLFDLNLFVKKAYKDDLSSLRWTVDDKNDLVFNI